MPDRNSSVGIVLLITGLVVASLGYLGAQSVPIAGFGFALATIGALILLLVPEVIPQDAYKALLKDSITNIEILLEESQLTQRAFFVPTVEGDVRAFIPLVREAGSEEVEGWKGSFETTASLGSRLKETMDKAPRRFFSDYRGLHGLVLVPPGNEIVRLSKIQRGEEDLEEALRIALISFSDLATSVLVVEQRVEDREQDRIFKIRIRGARLYSTSPYFNQCFGSPLSCVAACVVCFVEGRVVKIASEKEFDPENISLTVELIE